MRAADGPGDQPAQRVQRVDAAVLGPDPELVEDLRGLAAGQEALAHDERARVGRAAPAPMVQPPVADQRLAQLAERVAGRVQAPGLVEEVEPPPHRLGSSSGQRHRFAEVQFGMSQRRTW
jgi:hypothetical protein